MTVRIVQPTGVTIEFLDGCGIRYSTITVKDHHAELIRNLYRVSRYVSGENDSRMHVVACIKFFRDEYQIGLKEAKDACDALGNQ